MCDRDKAVKLLKEYGCTCVLCCGDTVYKSNVRGVAPMVNFIKEGTNLKGFSAADKVIGKAAAMLFVYAGVKSIYGEVMSKAAESVFQSFNVDYSFGTLTQYIINRKGTGMCPMEETVKDITELSKAYDAICVKLESLRKEHIK